MKGGKKRFNNMKAQLVDNCGPKWGKQMIAAGKETECRRLLGVSTPTEVLSADGFKGNWNPSVQPQVDKIVKQMSASKLYGPTMKKVLQTVGGGKALDTTDRRRGLHLPPLVLCRGHAVTSRVELVQYEQQQTASSRAEARGTWSVPVVSASGQHAGSVCMP